MKTKGFTLIELLVVISIISLLATVVLGSLNDARDKGRIAAGQKFDATMKHATGDRLVAEYTFDNDVGLTVTDMSGNGNDGTITANVLHINDGVFGQAVEFNANDEYVTLPISHSFADNVEGSYSFWFRSTSDQASNKYIFRPTTSRLDVNFETGSQKIFVFFYDSTPANHLVWKSSDSRYIDGRWHHIAVNKTATRINVYLDGVNVGGYNTTLTTNTDSVNGYLGSSGEGFLGDIDNVRVYSEALSVAEIKKHYVEGFADHQMLVSN